MAVAERGGTFTSDVIVRSGGLAGSEVDPDAGTLILTIFTPGAVLAVTVPQSGLTRLSAGHYQYTWGIAADAELGDWTWNWDASLDGVDLPDQAETVDVREAGSLSNRLTVEEIRQHVNTNLPDAAVQRLIDAAYSAVELFAPVSGAYTERLTGGFRDLILKYPALAVQSVVEGVDHGDRALATNDYLLTSPYVVERLHHGTNQRHRWFGIVNVTYTVSIDRALIDSVVIDLVKLAASYTPGVGSEHLGDYGYSMNTAGYANEYNAILGRLGGAVQAVIIQ